MILFDKIDDELKVIKDSNMKEYFPKEIVSKNSHSILLSTSEKGVYVLLMYKESNGKGSYYFSEKERIDFLESIKNLSKFHSIPEDIYRPKVFLGENHLGYILNINEKSLNLKESLEKGLEERVSSQKRFYAMTKISNILAQLEESGMVLAAFSLDRVFFNENIESDKHVILGIENIFLSIQYHKKIYLEEYLRENESENFNTFNSERYNFLLQSFYLLTKILPSKKVLECFKFKNQLENLEEDTILEKNDEIEKLVKHLEEKMRKSLISNKMKTIFTDTFSGENPPTFKEMYAVFKVANANILRCKYCKEYYFQYEKKCPHCLREKTGYYSVIIKDFYKIENTLSKDIVFRDFRIDSFLNEKTDDFTKILEDLSINLVPNTLFSATLGSDEEHACLYSYQLHHTTLRVELEKAIDIHIYKDKIKIHNNKEKRIKVQTTKDKTVEIGENEEVSTTLLNSFLIISELSNKINRIIYFKRMEG